MSLDRKTVDKTAGEHIRQMGAVSDKQKREIRRLHERMAAKAEAKGGKPAVRRDLPDGGQSIVGSVSIPTGELAAMAERMRRGH